MCLIKETTTNYPDGRPDIKETVYFCSKASGSQVCGNTRFERETIHAPKSMAMLPPAPRQEVVLHQDYRPRPKQEPPRERRYDGAIDVEFRGWKSPVFSIRKLSRNSSSRRRDDGEYLQYRDVLPEAPMPPPAFVLRPDNRWLPPRPPTSMPPTIVAMVPNRPLPSGPDGAAVFVPRDAIPSISSETHSRTSSSRSRDAYAVAQSSSRPPSIKPVAGTARSGSKKLRFDPNTLRPDSAYASSNISSIDEVKTESTSGTRSNTTSTLSMNRRYNYTNDLAPRGEDDFDDDGGEEKEKEKSDRSSRSGRSFRVVRRVVGENNPDETHRKTEEAINAAIEYQSQSSERGSADSGSRTRRHRRRRDSY
jgi:hypothetical protein